MKKRLICMLLACVMCLSIVACETANTAGDNDPLPSQSTTPSLSSPEDPEPSEDTEPSGEPAPSKEPVPSEDPTPSEKPMPSEKPAPSEEPVPSEDPTPSEKPVPSEKPAPSKAPEPSKEPTQQTRDKTPSSLSVQGVFSQTVGKSELQIGQALQLDVSISPVGASSGITWKSSDPSVAAVDEWGKVTALKKGKATITATTYNNVKATYTINVPQSLGELQYQLTSDGKGYEIIGCDADAYTAHIPASYNGLPVVSIKGGAFKDCANLRYFTVEAQQKTFYADGGVIFTDAPQKTLVCFPPSYDAETYYIVPSDTVKIASYAFAGLRKGICSLTIPEGVTAIGDRAFYEVQNWMVEVYVPDSLTDIGANLMEKQLRSVAFYGNANCAFATYANANQIPFALVFNFQSLSNTAGVGTPENAPLSSIPATNKNSVKFPSIDSYTIAPDDYASTFCQTFDLSSYQSANSGEIRLMLEKLYAKISPDVNGRTALNFPAQTGLYGAGYTESEAILRAYDHAGNLVAAKYVSENFAFSFPGAYNLGIEGGNNTTLTVVPVEPIFITTPGNYRLNPKEWHTLHDGNIMQYVIVQIPGSSYSTHFPNFLNNLTCSDRTEVENGYGVLCFRSQSAELVDSMSMVSIIFDGMDCLMDNSELVCWVASAFDPPTGFAKKTYEVLSTLKDVMIGTYYPASESVNKITIWGDGSYPLADWNSKITLDESVIADFDALTIAHEMVHAVDASIDAIEVVPPGAWSEGRAEYISRLVLDELGVDYWERSDNYDWSFLRAEEKADFFHYYYFSANRYTQYDVGYYFLCYINETYGEDISGKIMANMAALKRYDSTQGSEANATLFKKCVEDATEVGVFQNFVRDVIEK